MPPACVISETSISRTHSICITFLSGFVPAILLTLIVGVFQFAMADHHTSLMQKPSTYEHVQQADIDLDTPRRSRTFLQKLSLSNVAIFISSLLGTCLAVIFLAFMWCESLKAADGQQPGRLWSIIHAQTWETRVVTVCSVVIRIAVAAQMSIFAAMVAAIMLETDGVVLGYLPRLSMLRSVNNGPLSHTWSSFNFLRFRSVVGYIYFLAIAVALLNSLALQFTSTILLSDFGPATIVVKNEAVDVAFGYNASGYKSPVFNDSEVDIPPWAETVRDSWSAPSTTYPRFAEYRKNAIIEDNEFQDTGKTIRAFFPLGNSTHRQTLKEYAGPAAVYDLSTICMKPTIESVNITFISSPEHGSSVMPGANRAVSGLITGLPHPAFTDPDLFPFEFNCSVNGGFPNPATPRDKSWRVNLCWLPIKAEAAYANLSAYTGWGMSERLFEEYLLLNATSDTKKWEMIEESNGTWNEPSSGLWANYINGSSSRRLGLDVSYCITPGTVHQSTIKASAFSDYTEPVIEWNSTDFVNRTRRVRMMLGALSPSVPISERGILELQQLPDNFTEVWEDVTIATTFEERSSRSTRKNDSRGDNGGSWFTIKVWPEESTETNLDKDPYTYIDPGQDTYRSKSLFPGLSQYTVHPAHSVVFQDTLRDTQNPAKALQALLTIVLQNTYYDKLPHFTFSAPATWSTFESANIPVGWTGLVAISALLIIHYIMIAIAVILFTKTRASLLGNFWQGVAQVASGEAREVISKGLNSTEEEMKEYFGAKLWREKKIRITE